MSTEVQKKGHPKGLYMLFMVEMWERFSYYGMRALLFLFMTSPIISFTDKAASNIYGWFTGLVYLTPVIGGYLADRYLGRRKSIIIGAALMSAGQFALASYGMFSPRLALFCGLVLLIIGNGFFKPNISSMVGDLYEPNDNRRDGGFTIFYMGINVGAFFSPLICGALGEKIAFKYGFIAAGIGLIIGLCWFLLAQDKFLGKTLGVAPAGQKNKDDADANKPLDKVEKDKIKAVFTFSFFAIFFFTFFEQAGTSLTAFARDASDRLFHIPAALVGKGFSFFEGSNLGFSFYFGETWEMPVSFFQSLNPLFVVLLAPVFSKLWIKMGDRELSIPAKFASALTLLGIGYLIIMGGAAIYLRTGSAVSILWLTCLYLLHTMGELCLSPVGLSMVTKLAPAKFMSMLMGVWLMSSFFGNLMAGWLAGQYAKEKLVGLFSIPAIFSIVFAIIMWLLSKKIKTWMHGVK